MVMKGAACLILLFHLSLSPHYNSTEPRTPPAYLDKPIWMDNTFSSTYKGLSLKEQSPPAPTKPFIIAALYSFVFGWIISITWPKKPFFRGRKIDGWILSVGQVKCQKRSHHRIYLESHLKAELHKRGAFLTLAQSSMPLIFESRMGGCRIMCWHITVVSPLQDSPSSLVSLQLHPFFFSQMNKSAAPHKQKVWRAVQELHPNQIYDRIRERWL